MKKSKLRLILASFITVVAVLTCTVGNSATLYVEGGETTLEGILNSNLSDSHVYNLVYKRGRNPIELLAIPKLEVKKPINGVDWVTDQGTFDYILPQCANGASYAAIVLHGTNHMDLLSENDKGEFEYTHDASAIYPRLLSLCAAVGVPKSGLSTTYNSLNEANHWRTWWVSEGVVGNSGIPIRNDNDEIKATIEILKLAKSTLGGLPVYLVVGNDLGLFAAKVARKLKEDEETSIIDGFIYPDIKNGEFMLYVKGKPPWDSSEHTSP